MNEKALFCVHLSVQNKPAMIAITATSLRNKMRSYLERVSKSSETIFITRGASEEDTVVLMPMREYNSLMETAYLLSTEANRRSLEISIAQHSAGQTVPYNQEEVEKMLGQ